MPEVKCEMYDCIYNREENCVRSDIRITKEWNSDFDFGRGGYLVDCAMYVLKRQEQ